MTFHVTLVEHDQTVGNSDCDAVRQYLVKTVDTLPHAHRIATELEHELGVNANSKRRHVKLVDRGHPLEFGSIYRTSYYLVTTSE